MTGGSIRVPGADAKPEDWDKFYAKVGRPESADKYEVKSPTMPEGVSWDGEMQKGFLGEAHKAGLSTKQAQDLMNWYGAQTGGQFQAQIAQRTEAQTALTKDWGDSYQTNVKVAVDAFKQLVPENDPMRAWLQETGNDSNPILLRFFERIGREHLGEGKTIAGDHASTTGDAASAKSAQEEIANIMNDRKGPYHNPDMPGHKEARAKMDELYSKAYPGKAA